MSRPRPLSNITSARSVGPPEFQSLTPRTPHSRAGRAEEGYNQFELQQITDEAHDTFPASTTGYRSRGDDHDPRIRPQWDKRTGGAGQLQLSTVLARLPLAMGMLLGGFLLFLMYMSYTRPDKLHGYLGILDANKTMSSFDRNATVASDPKLLISYANYTNFPLRPSEYLAECRVLNQGYMAHGKYWEAPKKGVMDVAHSDEEGVCNNTITYMLGGDVGLLADLALLAQAAAVAREVAMLTVLFTSLLINLALAEE
ncbi:hypothetical protein H0H81_006871 [Sphagnurus paluster]|uniref:Uncharacterized protein n=1 Tax=Sphagnurus paluster TaxID=117069 RepID=A0A9P7GP11_9AGAR|nr:hypothetical protein H0H81_006871 [Sphagnurus paluster]